MACSTPQRFEAPGSTMEYLYRCETNVVADRAAATGTTTTAATKAQSAARLLMFVKTWGTTRSAYSSARTSTSPGKEKKPPQAGALVAHTGFEPVLPP